MPTLTLLSNGHGEDAVGALLARTLLRERPTLNLQAFPLVGRGSVYEETGIPVLGPRRALPSGGLLMHSPQLLWQDVRAGFLPMTLQQLRDLRRLRTDVLVGVGDVYALLLASVPRARARYQVQTLVSARHGGGTFQLNRYFMERVSYPERALMRWLLTHVYVRDEATAAWLRTKGLTHVSALGNPMLDALRGRALPQHAHHTPCAALLPGTRRYAADALTLMLSALAQSPTVTGLVAWAGGTLPPPPAPWTRCDAPPGSAAGLVATFKHKQQRAYVYEGRFADVLHSAQLVLGTSGTANEQAAALGRPVVSFPVPPLYTRAFLENQKRLLGAALSLSEPHSAAIARTLSGLLDDAESLTGAAEEGVARMGKPGGAEAIVRDILARSGL